MKIQCLTSNLADAVLKVQKAVAVKSSIPTLEGINIIAKNNSLELKGYDLELGITTTIPANVEKPGEIVLNARLLVEIARHLPDKNTNITVSEKLTTTITSGQSYFSIEGLNSEEYPEMPKLNESFCIEIESHKLKKMLQQTIFAISDDDSKPAHMGSLFEIEDGKLNIVSVDGYRFALSTENISSNINNKFIVPGKTLNEIIKLLSDDENVIKIFAGKRHVIFNINQYSVISRLLQGNFLDYKSAIPKQNLTTVKVKTNDLINAFERTSLIITDKFKSPVSCIFSENEIKFSCTTTIGTSTDQISAKVDGERIEIGFNSRYVLDALRNTFTDEIRLELNGTLSPMKITPINSENFIFLVLPVRLRSEV